MDGKPAEVLLPVMGGVTYSGALTGSVDVFPADFVTTTRSGFMGIHQA